MKRKIAFIFILITSVVLLALHLFLPFREKEYIWDVPSDITFFVEGNICRSGDRLRVPDSEKEFLIAIEKDGNYVDARYLRCMQAEQMPALSITVDKKGFEDEGEEESYADCEFGGHGNSTWLKDKKSFGMHFASPISMLGMGQYTKWNLIANGMDHSNIKNKIVYEAARRTDLEFSVECKAERII